MKILKVTNRAAILRVHDDLNKTVCRPCSRRNVGKFIKTLNHCKIVINIRNPFKLFSLEVR